MSAYEFLRERDLAVPPRHPRLTTVRAPEVRLIEMQPECQVQVRNHPKMFHVRLRREIRPGELFEQITYR